MEEKDLMDAEEITCEWCGCPIKEEVSDGFLTGVFGYTYCSIKCMTEHIESK